MKAINEFLNLIKRNRELCPWFKTIDSDYLISALEDEINEMKNATDHDNLEEEVGDVLWVYFLLLDKLDVEGKVEKSRVIERIIEKISRRKPYLIDGKKVTVEEARKIWFEAKRKEKQ